jgi:hypothetical protein
MRGGACPSQQRKRHKIRMQERMVRVSAQLSVRLLTV